MVFKDIVVVMEWFCFFFNKSLFLYKVFLVVVVNWFLFIDVEDEWVLLVFFNIV